MAKQEITEEMGVHKEWMVEAKDMTLEKLPEFLRKLTQDYHHDYGTICHAIAAGAIAGAWSVERTPQGGITGFQAWAIMWEMIRGWGVFGDGPKTMTKYENMLYPQYAESFRSISPDVWEWLQKKAKENLEAKGPASDNVIAHWKTIVGGEIPFGYRISKE